jgi:AcrR family transcriptional regulator
MDEPKKATRRRGEILEEAILHAAWKELIETGYKDMTMESVATRAGTNKAVLYRRWDNKSELVMAALRKFMPKITDAVPNTGSLRDDVYAYLHLRVDPLKKVGAQTIRGLLLEPVVWHTLVESMPHIIELRTENKMTKAMAVILRNADQRGEIQLEKLTPRIIALPLDLLEHELMTRLEPISDEIITEIVDDIFMPLVEYSQKEPR